MPKSQRLPNALLRKARAWAGQLTQRARAYAPAHIREYISSSVDEKSNGEQFIIRIKADRFANPQEREGSLDARAQEYGSGLQSRRGLKAKYPILPKNRQALAFYWEVADNNPEYFTFLDDGRVLLRKVMHPGIQAANEGKGYIGPAVKELRVKAREELDVEIRKAITGDIRASFGGAKKKK
jgi:hypothetical protein